MQIQISWLLQKPTDLDLHCLQRQGISGFSRTRVKVLLQLIPHTVLCWSIWNSAAILSWSLDVYVVLALWSFWLTWAEGSGWAVVITPLLPSRLSVHPSVHTFERLLSEILGPNFFKLHVEPCVKRGLQICTNGHGPLIKMAAMPVYSSHRLIMGRI